MKGTNHQKSSGSLCRVCTGLLLIFATIISGWSTSGCATQQTRRRPLETTAASSEISIIPQPDLITLNKGYYFDFARDTKIIAADGAAHKAATSLNTILTEKYKFKLDFTNDTRAPNSITFLEAKSDPEQSEAYSLKIEPGAIQISGSERGMFYGIQSLVQLFPVDFNGEARIPAAEIRDAPRFPYRGMHLDVSRHFMPVKFVKEYIRLISSYKYNSFHWHLTDDQGWRIEINEKPKLTEVGSKRPETVLGLNYPRTRNPPNPYNPYIGDHTPVEGYYKQDDIREIVEYARARYVTIIPEIELPGHSSAALASYPELGCRKNYRYKVQTTWGTFPDIYCPTEENFGFIKDVLSDVMKLFPDSRYIHIGADEVTRMESWRNSKAVQDLKRAKGLTSETAVLSMFLKEVESFVNSKGKKIIGWDEMLDVGVPPNATVMAWRPSQAYQMAVKAARAKHDVIMAPFELTYLDHPQTNSPQEPLSLYTQTISLSDVYNFEPMPAGLSQEEANHILGGEGCLWTEFMKGPSEVEYMMFPRAIALAEVLWSKPEKKNLALFYKKLAKEFPKLAREQVNYRGSSSTSLQSTTLDIAPDFPKPVKPIAGQPQVPANMPCPEFYHPAYVIVGGKRVLNCVQDF